MRVLILGSLERASKVGIPLNFDQNRGILFRDIAFFKCSGHPKYGVRSPITVIMRSVEKDIWLICVIMKIFRQKLAEFMRAKQMSLLPLLSIHQAQFLLKNDFEIFWIFNRYFRETTAERFFQKRLVE